MQYEYDRCSGGRTPMPRPKGSADLLEDRRKRALALLDAGHSLNEVGRRDRKSTRLNSSHSQISYAVFCLKKKNILPLRCTRLGHVPSSNPTHSHRASTLA